MEHEVPSVSNINTSLTRIQHSLARVGVESPHLQEQLKTLEGKRSELETSLVASQRALEDAYKADAKAKAQRELIIERARVVGRIGAFLEQAGKGPEDETLPSRIEAAKLKVDALEKGVNADEDGQRLDTFLALISKKMSEYARRLEIEHVSDSVRLDIKKLTVVADDGRLANHDACSVIDEKALTDLGPRMNVDTGLAMRVLCHHSG